MTKQEYLDSSFEEYTKAAKPFSELEVKHAFDAGFEAGIDYWDGTFTGINKL